jgi:hypothetical protein
VSKKPFYKSMFFTSWFVFFEGWLFGHYLGLIWAVAWMSGWYLLGRAIQFGMYVQREASKSDNGS